MAIAENGPNGHHRGRIGNIVYYVLNGKNVSRTIGTSTKPPTNSQLRSRMVTKMSSGLFRNLLDFINTGFGIIAIQAMDNASNQAKSYNKNRIIKGVYPDLEIAYDQLQVSKGSLKPAQNWQVALYAEGLQYSWDTDPEMPWPDATDQVMMMAYFPKQEKVVFNLFGSSRFSGGDVLEIPPSLRGEYMETYVSFISANRKQVADSSYTGHFNRETSENLTLIS
nr:DUF6266 family protein [uncultured Pedobacter sp.]